MTAPPAPVGALVWDSVGDRTYEAGVDKGVLYLPDDAGVYGRGYAWNGLTTVTESPSGAAANPQYADNIKYLNLFSAEEFGGTIAAFTYPDEFMECDGTAVPEPGVFLGQQGRRAFGLSYRTRVGNDVDGIDHGVWHDQRLASGTGVLLGLHLPQGGRRSGQRSRLSSGRQLGDRLDQGGSGRSHSTRG
jgi:hypothetical protein